MVVTFRPSPSAEDEARALAPPELPELALTLTELDAPPRLTALAAAWSGVRRLSGGPAGYSILRPSGRMWVNRQPGGASMGGVRAIAATIGSIVMGHGRAGAGALARPPRA
jgi:hypothetical protein